MHRLRAAFISRISSYLIKLECFDCAVRIIEILPQCYDRMTTILLKKEVVNQHLNHPIISDIYTYNLATIKSDFKFPN